MILAVRILVVTTASGRAVWRKAFQEWPAFPRSVSIDPSVADVQILSWAGATQAEKRAALLKQRFDLLILDESHAAKSFDAARTCSVYGDPRSAGDEVAAAVALRSRAAVVWCLSATPCANSPADLYPMMRSLCPERLAARGDMPDVLSHAAFMDRYVITRPKRISRFRSIDVVVGGQNLEELRTRLDGFVNRRTQADVGIRAPIYETLPLLVSEKQRRALDNVDTIALLKAADEGDTKALEMHLGPLRRLTGEIKAKAVVEAVKEALDNGLDKIVLMAWHTDVILALGLALMDRGVAFIDGSTSAKHREEAEQRFRDLPNVRVFIGQIQAAGEAIDLSAACELWFVESSFVPKDMAQAALRITNHTQRRQAFVKVCTLAGSIDEALQSSLMRKWSAIREVLK
ncbi:hypothetical protein ASF22_02490 [Methylobacterium sp. Leaf87]|nr:hypothetical protein ASF22_02490 [Methylobacterium sp. Leaf87]